MKMKNYSLKFERERERERMYKECLRVGKVGKKTNDYRSHCWVGLSNESHLPPCVALQMIDTSKQPPLQLQPQICTFAFPFLIGLLSSVDFESGFCGQFVGLTTKSRGGAHTGN